MKLLYIIISVLAISNIVTLHLFLHSRWSYRKLMQKNLQKEEQRDELVGKIAYDSTPIHDEQERKLLDNLRKCMETDKMFLNPNLSIIALSKALGTNKTTLSHVINTHLHQNFASLLNSYRIREAIDVLSNPKFFDEKMEVVAEKCGYNNRQVFHTAFKKVMGITPNHFRNIQRATLREAQRKENGNNFDRQNRRG